MSNFSHRPTIVAIATASAPAAVGLLRISGPQAFEIADLMCSGKASSSPPRTARLRRIVNEFGQLIDEVLVTRFPAPHSYTGENVCEIAGHGGTLVMRSLLDRALACGATLAGPGEFTQQAFMHGKLDLTQAEGVMDLISAKTHYALRAAHEQREGRLGRRTEEARDALLECIAHVEAYIDFPEEDISPDVGSALINRLFTIKSSIDSLLSTADRGRILREGLRTVIIGPPNAGKSSLLNRLLGFERAIVSQIAGTTRDTIEESVNCGGFLLRLIDTAGIREDSTDVIEKEGIRRSVEQQQRADLILTLADGTLPQPQSSIQPHHPQQQVLHLLNKTDEPEHTSWQGSSALRISCKTGAGMDALERAIVGAVVHDSLDHGESLVAINARHQDCLRRSMDSLRRAIPMLEQGEDLTLVSIELRDAMEALGEISGKMDSDDILGVIFSRFCIGK